VTSPVHLNIVAQQFGNDYNLNSNCKWMCCVQWYRPSDVCTGPNECWISNDPKQPQSTSQVCLSMPMPV